MCHSAAVIAPAVIGGLLFKGALISGLLLWLRHHEHKERRALDKLVSGSGAVEEKTVIVENRGPRGGAAGFAEVVTTGPAGTVVTSHPTVAGGAVVVSTATAGIVGGPPVTVDPGRTAIVKAEHPVGRPEETTVVSTTHA